MSFRSTIPFLCLLLVLLPLSISLGRCSNISFSICWFNNDASESQEVNIWLNGTALGSIGTAGKLTSLTVCPNVRNTLSLQYGDSLDTWAFTLHPRTKHIKVKGEVKPKVRPTNKTQSILQSMRSSDVFACENSTLFFYQDQDFFLAIGYTSRLPVKLESRSNSMLLLSWGSSLSPAPLAQGHNAWLYGSELDHFTAVAMETTSDTHHRFTGLDSCTVYVACVELYGTNALTCVSTITDPDKPGDVQVWWVNSSSLALTWDCPANRQYSMFLLTVFHHQGESQSIKKQPEEEKVWIREPLEWTLSDLAPCSRLSFGLQTVCVSGAETRYSPMVVHQGNSDLSNVLNLIQSSIGPEHYSLSWEVGSHSSVSKFRVFHDGEEQGTTLNPSFTVRGLQPCQSHSATVQALCGEGTLMDAQTLQVHTEPRGVSDLSFVPDDNTAVWIPGTKGPHVSFMFKVFRDDESEALWSGRVSEPHLPLSGLQRALSYRLSVWEDCEELGQSQKTSVEFTPKENEVTDKTRPGEVMVRAARLNASRAQDYADSVNEIPVIVPWTLPEDFQDQNSDPWAQMATILQDRMEKLLIDYHSPVHVVLMKSGPAEVPGHTQYLFSVFKKSTNQTTGAAMLDQPLWIHHELEALWSPKNFSLKNGDAHWEGPDLCQTQPCPKNSLCLNTLDSFSCLCRKDHYDVRAFMKKPAAANSPICNDKGLFSRCLDKQLVGGISKLYLSSRLQGALKVSLNEGQCPVNLSGDFYLFKTSRNNTHCGTKRRVNDTHIELQNTLTVTAGVGVRRRHMRALLKCVYPRHYQRSALVGLDLDWVSSVSVVAYNSSLQLGLSMNLFGDHSFSSSYSDTVMLGPEDTLFFQVSLHASHSFIQDVRLQVESCWATESTDPHDQTHGIILQDGCPTDDTFSWLSENGASQSSRFSVQMFQMPQALPLYFHCRAAVCSPQDNCTKSCSRTERRKRSVFSDARAVVVSAGPLVVTEGRTRGKPSNWSEHMTVITAVAGTIGFLFVALLFVSAAKAVMSFYQRRRLQ